MSVGRGFSVKNMCTVCVTAAVDETKLRLFVVFKASENGPVAYSLLQIMASGVNGCNQLKGWMGNRVMQPWKEEIWMPYVKGKRNSVPFLDQM